MTKKIVLAILALTLLVASAFDWDSWRQFVTLNTAVDNALGDTGVLYGVGDFASPRAVLIGDTLNVQVTLTAAAA